MRPGKRKNWKGKSDAAPTLRAVGKTGRLVTAYLPAILGRPAACAKLSPRQHLLLQQVVRETTRRSGEPTNEDEAAGLEASDADVFGRDQVTGTRGARCVVISNLGPAKKYVGFNGNGYLRGRG